MRPDDSLWEQLEVADGAGLKESLRMAIELRRRDEEQEKRRDAVEQFLEERCQFPLPAEALEDSVQNLLAGLQSHLSTMNEVDLCRGPIGRMMANAAERKLRLDLIVDMVAQQESITPTEKDLGNALFRRAREKNVDPEVLWKRWKEDPNRLQQLQREALRARVLDWIVERVEFSHCAVSEDAAPSEANST